MKLRSEILSFFRLFKAADYSKGFLFAVAAILPLVVSGYFDRLSVGIPMAIGVLLSSPSDVPGSFHRRLFGVFFSVLIAVAGSLLAGYAAGNDLFFVPVLIVLMFSFSMISVYGFRASLVSFSGLFAVVLSLASVSVENSVLVRSLLIGAGGLWYLALTALFHYLSRKREIEQLLSEAFELTADYLEARNRSFKNSTSEELVNLQTLLNEKHETLRELLISGRRHFGRSDVMQRRLLIFMELVDILELGMTNPVKNDKMQQLFRNHKERLELVVQWNSLMASELRKIAEKLDSEVTIHKKLEDHRQKVWTDFKRFEKEADLPAERGTLLAYRNLLAFKDRQHKKITAIKRLINEHNRREEFKLQQKDAVKFLSTEDYSLKILQDHLDIKSPIFRHSLRLTTVLVLGYLLGQLFAFQNSYWILITTLVIMRPGYALTHARYKQRLYGTLIGGAVAVSLVLLIQNRTMYGVMAVITLVLAFSTIQKNYKAAAAFITLNVIFVYSLLRPDVLDVIRFRIFDTLVGAFLAFVGNKFLWPTWEYLGIGKYFTSSIDANLTFLKEIESAYVKKDISPASYRLARKKAFLAVGDLNAAFQRMTQEPKKGEDLDLSSKMLSLNQEFLNSTASLGTFIRTEATTKASPYFRTYMKAIKENLSASNPIPSGREAELEAADEFYREQYESLALERKQEQQTGQEDISEELRAKFREVQLVHEQLQWLYELSLNLRNLRASHKT